MVFGLRNAQKHLHRALMALQVLQQRILTVEAQMVAADELANGFHLGAALLQLLLAVVVELPVEEPPQLLLHQPGMSGGDVVPEGGVLLSRTLGAPAGGQPDAEVLVARRTVVARAALHQLPHTVVEVEGVGDADAARLRIRLELPPGVGGQVGLDTDQGHAAVLI